MPLIVILLRDEICELNYLLCNTIILLPLIIIKTQVSKTMHPDERFMKQLNLKRMDLSEPHAHNSTKALNL